MDFENKKPILMNGKRLSQLIKWWLEGELHSYYSDEELAKMPPNIIYTYGDDPASKVYIDSKLKGAAEIGIPIKNIKVNSIDEYFNCLKIYDKNGTMLQLPIKEKYRTRECINAINPSFDIDGMHPLNIGKLVEAESFYDIDNRTLMPCTPFGILLLLIFYRIKIQGKKVTVIGRSNIVGKPISTILSKDPFNATVTMCNSYTPNLSSIITSSDIVISAAGVSVLITERDINLNVSQQTFIDVGINVVGKTESGKRIINGDCAHSMYDYESSTKVMITPVPGGVGPMTVAALMCNMAMIIDDFKHINFHSICRFVDHLTGNKFMDGWKF